jgi:hypothetical protein
MTILSNVLAAVLLAAAIQPAVADIHVEGSLYQEKSAAPGATYRGAVAIRNSGNAPVAVKLYQTDYTFSSAGANQYSAPGTQPRSNGAWVSLAQEQVTVPPHATASVSYDVAVPADASLKGSYWSMIMIEPLSPAEAGNASALKKGQVRAAVTTVTRFGVQVASEIGNNGTRELRFANPRLTKGKDGKPSLAIDVSNTGERTLRPSLALDLHNAQGAQRKGLSGAAQRLYPASAAQFQMDISAVPKGTYRALVTADAGGDDVFGSQFDLTID